MPNKGKSAPAIALKSFLLNLLLGAFIGVLISIAYFKPKISITPEKVLCLGPSQQVSKARDVETTYEIREDGFHLINPLLDCELGNELENNELSPAKEHIEEYVDEVLSNGTASKASVYFRDLNNGPWYGINENEKYSPASLVKVTVMLALMKHSETDPRVVDTRVKIMYPEELEVPKNPLPPEYLPPDSLIRGEEYELGQLIYRSIVYSDNEAHSALLDVTDAGWLRKVYSDLGLFYPEGDDVKLTTTAKEFSAVFRVLYNASYLSRSSSENALALLAESVFDKGLRKGVPSGVIVASKFGIKKVPETGEYSLHDCGIIYAPDSPYLLCVMMQGAKFDKLAEIIAKISESVYEENRRVYNSMP